MLSIRRIWKMVPLWASERPRVPPLEKHWPFLLLAVATLILWWWKRRGREGFLLRADRLAPIERFLAALDGLSPLKAAAGVLASLAVIAVLLAAGPHHGLRYRAHDLDRPEEVRTQGHSPSGMLNAPLIRTELPGSRRIAIRWEGDLYVPQDIVATLRLDADGDTVVRIDGEEVVRGKTVWGPEVFSATVELTRGSHPIVIECLDEMLRSSVELFWDLPGKFVPVSPRYLTERPQGWLSFHLYPVIRVLVVLDGLAAMLFLVRLLVPFLGRTDAGKVRWTRVAVGMVVGAGVVRLGVVVMTRAMTLADEAIVTIMAEDIITGKNFPLMYYGQHYGGALLAYIHAPLVGLLQDPLLASKLTSVLLGCLYVFLALVFVRRTAGVVGAVWTGLLLVVPQATTLLLGLSSMVGPTEICCVGMLLLIWLPVLADSPRPPRLPIFGLGLATGLAFWEHLQIVYFLAPIGLWALWRFRRTIRLAPWFLPGFLLGFLPLIVYNWGAWPPITYVEMVKVYTPTIAHIFWSRLIMENLGVLLGGRVRYDRFHDIAPPLLAFLALVLLVGGLFWLALSRRREQGERSRVDAVRILVLFFPTALVLFITSRFGFYGSRHFYSVLLMIPVLAGVVLGLLWRSHPRTATLLGLPLLLLHVWSLAGSRPSLYFQTMHGFDMGTTLAMRYDPILDRLREERVDTVNAEYWIAFSLMAENRQSMVAYTYGRRFPPYRERFLNGKRVGHLFHPNEFESATLLAFLRRTGLDTDRVGVYYAAWPRVDTLPRNRWHAVSEWSPETVALAVDGDLGRESVWHAPAEEPSGIEVRFDEPVIASRVSVYEGIDSKRNFFAEDPVPVRLEVLREGSWVDLGGMRIEPYLSGDLAEFPTTVISGLRLTCGEEGKTSPWAVRDIIVYPGAPAGGILGAGENIPEVPQP